MALIKCKECGKEISNKAKSCPHCGYSEEKQNKNKIDLAKTYFKNNKKIAFLILGGIIVLIIIIASCSSNKLEGDYNCPNIEITVFDNNRCNWLIKSEKIAKDECIYDRNGDEITFTFTAESWYTKLLGYKTRKTTCRIENGKLHCNFNDTDGGFYCEK